MSFVSQICVIVSLGDQLNSPMMVRIERERERERGVGEEGIF